jgi:hypothetical protein
MFEFLTPFIKDIGGVVDNLSTTDEERLNAQAKLREIEAGIEKSMNDHMNKVVAAQRSILEKEIGSESKFVKYWRPALMWLIITILGFNFLFVPVVEFIRTSFDLNFWIPQTIDLPSQMWSMLTIGLGGYVTGRSAVQFAEKWKK